MSDLSNIPTEELLAMLQSGGAPPAAPSKPLTNDNPNPIDKWILEKLGNQLAKAPDIQGSVPGRFIQGAADLPVGAMQLGLNAVGQGDLINPKIAEVQARMQALRGPDAGFDFARLAGNMANPVGFGVVGALKPAAGALGRIGQGAAIGAGYGAGTPVTEGNDYWKNKAIQTAEGAGLGTALSGGVEAAKGAGKFLYSAIEPAFEKGRAAILDRYQQALAGDKRDALVQALKSAQELVPGSQPTAGEAIAALPESTALAAHQRIISKSPEASTAFQVRGDQQEAARRAAIGTVAQTPEALSAAETARSETAKQLYKIADLGGIRPTDITSGVKGEITKLLQRPAIQDAVKEARTLARNEGIKLNDPMGSVKALDYVKRALDDKIRQTEGNEQRILIALKDRLLTTVDKLSPDYQKARQTFAEMSKPINEIQVGQYLEGKLLSPLTGTERAGMYAQALRDAPGTIKRSTGINRFDELGQVLNPTQEATVRSVGSDLAREAQFGQRAASTNLTGGTQIGEASAPHLPNLLMRKAMIANFIMKQLGQSAEQRINQLSGERYLDPAKLADALKGLPTQQRSILVNELMKMRNPLMIGAPASAAAEQY